LSCCLPTFSLCCPPLVQLRICIEQPTLPRDDHPDVHRVFDWHLRCLHYFRTNKACTKSNLPTGSIFYAADSRRVFRVQLGSSQTECFFPRYRSIRHHYSRHFYSPLFENFRRADRTSTLATIQTQLHLSHPSIMEVIR